MRASFHISSNKRLSICNQRVIISDEKRKLKIINKFYNLCEIRTFSFSYLFIEIEFIQTLKYVNFVRYVAFREVHRNNTTWCSIGLLYFIPAFFVKHSAMSEKYFERGILRMPRQK